MKSPKILGVKKCINISAVNYRPSVQLNIKYKSTPTKIKVQYSDLMLNNSSSPQLSPQLDETARLL